MSAPDRLEQLKSQNEVTGIDFIYVHETQTKLDVHFYEPFPSELASPLGADLDKDQVIIYNPSGDTQLSPISVTSLLWIESGNVLQIETTVPGDFALYRLYINDDRIDPYFNNVTFSFKAGCKSDLDCEPSEHECPIEDQVDFPVDYQARDFWSFRRALLDFASLRYPDWQDRLEADAGMMLIEVMSALGDELAYYQDRIAREAYLETASQRRSIRRHANLVDYRIHDGLGAFAWLDVTVKTGQSGTLPAGTDVCALADSGLQIDYEIGKGLADTTDYEVDSARNTFEPHIWDEDDTCLPVGTTGLYIKGHHEGILAPDIWVLLRTFPEDPSISERAFVVRLTEVEDTEDPVFNEDITLLAWGEEHALVFEVDMTVLEIHGNLVPATAGKTEEQLFVIGADPDDLTVPDEEKAKITRAVEREGPNGSVIYLLTLPDPDSEGLVWLGDDPQDARPEILLEEVEFDGSDWLPVTGKSWDWKRSFLGSPSSQPYDRDFILDDGTWQRVVGYRRIGEEIEHIDYASGEGNTIRFGDGEFGLVPAEGTIFRATYRLGNGRQSNLPADSITGFDSTLIESLTNPLPADNGEDAETPTEVRQLAPEAFRSITYRAVRPEDYAEAAERLAWVQRAGASFRWTGSWLSAFVTPDPKGAVTVSESQRSEIVDQLDRFRQAGREAYMFDPKYANLDLEITVCVEPYAYRGEVKEIVLEALFGESGFFSPDNFTFGDPLDRSELEAAIQDVPGVRAVKGMKIRRRGWFGWRNFTELYYEVGMDEIVRVENDPIHPGRGTVRLVMEGGA